VTGSPHTVVNREAVYCRFMTKPLPGLGLVIGIIGTYVAVGCAGYATPRLMLRLQTLENAQSQSLPWLALLLLIAVVLGLLMIAPRIGAGVTTGAGVVLTLAGLAVTVLPVRQAFDLVNLFEFPESRFGASYLLFDGSSILLGVPLLLVGIRRWASDAKLAKGLQPQDAVGYQSTYPQQQWGGYPGQQPYQPPQPPGQPPQQPGQPPQYPGTHQ
jgi:hypothetical protein